MEAYTLDACAVFSNYTGTDENLYIPEGVTNIGDCGENHTVRQLFIPEGVKEIRPHALAQFFALERLHLPASLETFEGNVSKKTLVEITVAKGNPWYKVQGNCLIDQTEGKLILGCKTSSIPDDGSVRKIARNAFTRVKSLKRIHIPKSVIQIDPLGFFSSGLETITVDPDNPVYYSTDNCIIETGSGTLVVGCKNSRIPNDGSIRHIGPKAFSGNDDLEEIIIPEGVLTLERGAFSSCYHLQNVSLPTSLRKIGPWVFSHCPKLAHISMHDRLYSIDDWAMYYCSKELLLNFHGTMQQWDAIYKSPGWTLGLPLCTDGWKGVKAVLCTDGTVFSDC